MRRGVGPGRRLWPGGRRPGTVPAWPAAGAGYGFAAVPARSVGVVTTEGLVLDIPPAEQAAARARGACWDDPSQRWCVPAGPPVAVHRFRRWIAAGTVVDDGPTVTTRLIGLQTYCAACGVPVVALAGVLAPDGLSLDPEGLVAFDDVAEPLAAVCHPGVLAGCGVGPLRWRHSAVAPQGRVTNGCRSCDVLIESAAVAGWLAEHRAGGGSCADLALGLEAPVPVAVLEWAATDVSRRAP